MVKGFGTGSWFLIQSLVFVVLLTSCAAAPPERGKDPLKTVSLSAIRGFQNLLSPVDGDRCMMLPSCSVYAGQVIEKHGFFMGWIMTCDRLMRCGHDELTRSEVVMMGGQSYCYDPVENNDFWWIGGRP